VIFMISFGACVPVEPWYPAPINEHRSLGKGGTGWGGGRGCWCWCDDVDNNDNTFSTGPDLSACDTWFGHILYEFLLHAGDIFEVYDSVCMHANLCLTH
jgi:hypothetical protein